MMLYIGLLRSYTLPSKQVYTDWYATYSGYGDVEHAVLMMHNTIIKIFFILRFPLQSQFFSVRLQLNFECRIA